MRPTGYEKLPYEKQFQSGQKFWKNVGQLWCDLQKSLGESLEIFGKWSEILGRSSKTLSSVYIYYKKNITGQLQDMNFMFSWQAQYLTSELLVLPLEHKNSYLLATM